MPIQRYSLGPMDNNTYLIVDAATGEAALVDPSFESATLWPEMQAQGVTIRYILNTHAHFDHIVGNAFYVAQTQAPLALHRADLELLRALPQQAQMFGFAAEPSPEPTLFLEAGQTLTLGETQIAVRCTPGHSPGGVTFLAEGAALVGDCLFARSIGRTDLPGGSLQTLLHSIRTQLLTLPDETPVLPGHGPTTTIGAERRQNPYLQE
jgi:glyoxylase-like metal-dependent hydrolase (beta-lactamase superfamily II)